MEPYSFCRTGPVKGFTLVELMAVMAVMAILGVVAVTAIGGLADSSLNTGGSLAFGLASQAHQNAVTKEAMTALVVVKAAPTTDLNYRLIILMELDPKASGTATSYAWNPISKWYVLPEGVMVEPTSTFITTDPTPLPTDMAVSYKGTSISQGSLAYQVFMPGGELDVRGETTPYVTPLLRLVKGNNGNILTGAANTANYYDVAFNLYTGTLTINRP